MNILFSNLCKTTFKASGGDRALNMGLKHVISLGLNAFSERAEHTLASDHKVSLIKEQYTKIVSLKFVVVSEIPQLASESVNVASTVPRQRSSSDINPMFLKGYAKHQSNNEKYARDEGDLFPFYREGFVALANSKGLITKKVSVKEKSSSKTIQGTIIIIFFLFPPLN